MEVKTEIAVQIDDIILFNFYLVCSKIKSMSMDGAQKYINDKFSFFEKIFPLS